MGADMGAAEAVIDLGRIAEVTGGRVAGDGAFQVKSISSLENAAADSLAFYGDPQQASKLKATAAGAVMLRAEHAGLFVGHKVIVADPYLAFARASALFAPPATATPGRIHPSALISPGASIHADAAIGPYSVIGENARVAQGVIIGAQVSIGADCVLGPHTIISPGVHLHARTIVGARCNLSSGVVIGESGFGYAENHGEWVRIEQLGGVVIGDDVDIGANTTIDRGALDDTVIGNGVKLDNQIQIGHNVRVGEHTIMAACVAVAGSAVIGKRCQLGGRASILGHLEITDEVIVHADSFVAAPITEAGVYSAVMPAQPAAQWKKIVAHIHRLERLAQKVKTLERNPNGDKDE